MISITLQTVFFQFLSAVAHCAERKEVHFHKARLRPDVITIKITVQATRCSFLQPSISKEFLCHSNRAIIWLCLPKHLLRPLQFGALSATATQAAERHCTRRSGFCCRTTWSSRLVQPHTSVPKREMLEQTLRCAVALDCCFVRPLSVDNVVLCASWKRPPLYIRFLTEAVPVLSSRYGFGFVKWK